MDWRPRWGKVESERTWIGMAVLGEVERGETHNGMDRRYMEGMTREGVRWNGRAVLGEVKSDEARKSLAWLGCTRSG